MSLLPSSDVATSAAAPTAQDKPTRVRYQVLGMALILGMVTYLDRVCISKLAPNMMADLHLSKVQMGYAFSAFALSYAAFGTQRRVISASPCGQRI